MVLAVLPLLLSQTACLRTRGMIREDKGFEVPPAQAQAQTNAYVIDELKAEITRLTGRIEELERPKAPVEQAAPEADPRLKAIEERIIELEKAQLAMIQAIKGQKPLPQQTDASTEAPKSDFELGKAHFEAGKFEAAIEALSRFVSQPGKAASGQISGQIEEATALVAESYFLLKQYQSAIVEYSKIPEKFPKSRRVPAALLRIAESFESMGFSNDANGFYQEVVDRFPKTGEAKKARRKLKSSKPKKSATPSKD